MHIDTCLVNHFSGCKLWAAHSRQLYLARQASPEWSSISSSGARARALRSESKASPRLGANKRNIAQREVMHKRRSPLRVFVLWRVGSGRENMRRASKEAVAKRKSEGNRSSGQVDGREDLVNFPFRHLTQCSRKLVCQFNACSYA